MRPAIVWGDDGGSYGVPRRDVLAVMRAPPLSPVPDAPPWLLGVANRFGRAVPVIDCRLLAGGVRSANAGPVLHAVVLPVEGGEIALAAGTPPEERVVASGGEIDGFYELPAGPEELRLVDTRRLVAAIIRAMP